MIKFWVFLINVSNIYVYFSLFFKYFCIFYRFVITFLLFSVSFFNFFLRFFFDFFFYKNITWKLLVNLPFLSHMLPYSLMLSCFFCSFFFKKFLFISFFSSPYCTFYFGEYRSIFHDLKIVFNGSLCQLANACLFFCVGGGCLRFLFLLTPTEDNLSVEQ